VQNTGQHLSNGLIVDNTVRIKSERLSDATQNNFFHDQFGQEDLMSALLKQVGFSALFFLLYYI
jgi:two-component response regulator (ARR-B family)